MAGIGIGSIVPTLAEVEEAVQMVDGNVVPVYKELIADLETPVSTFLKLREGEYSFLLESVEGGERLARYSFVGSTPSKVLTIGDGSAHALHGDPVMHLEAAMAPYTFLPIASVKLPPFTGGAVGYVAYDAVRHFEPRTAPYLDAQTDTMDIPEAVFMMVNSLVVFDHVRHTIKVVAHCHLPSDRHDVAFASALATSYAAACERIEAMCARLAGPLPIHHVSSAVPIAAATLPGSPVLVKGGGATAAPAPAAAFDWEAGSNVGQSGYEGFVESLKAHIIDGDIIQAVPSQRITRELPPGVTALDIYRQLRVVNPSPYMFYLELGSDFQIVGASPEMLVKVDTSGAIFTHPIAGTRKRGRTPEEDEALAAELLGDEKERAEHLMLVDLGRNDVGRVSAPGSVKVDSLMHIERYSHVMHIVSNVSGRLAPGKTAYDAFRSIFPAGTVSGAPKVKAMELVASLERQKRHVYAGAVGYVGYTGVMDTAIAIRTLVVRGNKVYLQAGGGIVFDSERTFEYEETLNKLRATMRAVDAAIAAAEAPQRAANKVAMTVTQTV